MDSLVNRSHSDFSSITSMTPLHTEHIFLRGPDAKFIVTDTIKCIEIKHIEKHVRY
jgi:hypothetical protein